MERMKTKKQIGAELISLKIEEFLSKGYSILKREDVNYFHFSDGKAIGYCEFDDSRWDLRFSTVNKPNRDHGTGEGTDENGALKQPRLRFSKGEPIKYYENFQQFVEQYWDKNAVVIRPTKQ